MIETNRCTFLKYTTAGLAFAGLAPDDAPALPSPMTPEELRSRLLECLGGSWPEAGPLHPRLRETSRKDGYRIESVTYEAPSGLGDGVIEAIPALLLVPDGVDASHPAPAVAVWHQHNGEWHLGKSEPAGLAGDPSQHTGVALVKEG